MALHGYTKLELARAGKVVKRIEKHNVISPYMSNLTKQGNLWYMESGISLYPIIDKLLGGVLLTDKVNPDGDEVSGFFGMLGGDSNIVAQCSNDAYNGNNARRGSYNTNESGVITGGFRHVFDWGTDRGNGTINGVCLCKPQMARFDYSDTSSRIPSDDSVMNENLGWIYSGNSGVSIDNAFASMDVIDYEREKGFTISYSSGTITVTEYELNTKRFHILGAVGGVIGSSSHTISQSVSNYSADRSTATICYTGDYIHLITFSGSTLNDYAIDVSDWSCEATSHTFSGASFTTFRSDSLLVTAGMLIKGGYLYAISGSSGQKIVKCNLSNDADVTEYDNPVYSVAGSSNWGNGGNHGSFVLMPNGDFYIIDWNVQNANGHCVYFHDGSFYYCKRYYDRLHRSIFSNAYGTLYGVSTLAGGGRSNSIFLDTAFPFVSTVNNLEEAVTKSADLTMKLTYELTETSN